MLTPTIRYILAFHALALGAGYLLGPAQWYSGSTFSVVRSLGVPVPVWGGGFVAAALLLLARQYTAGHAVAVFLFLFWGGSLAWSLPAGQLSGWGSPIHNLLLALPLHLSGLWRHRRERATGSER
jgi:hypothetical protein